jgi:hypothetical protein
MEPVSISWQAESPSLLEPQKHQGLDDVAIAIALDGRASDERGTLWTQCLWMNFFFTILAMAKIEKIEVPKTITEGGN